MILVLILVIAVVLAVLYNKGIICKSFAAYLTYLHPTFAIAAFHTTSIFCIFLPECFVSGKKSEEKGDESAEGDLEGGMNNEEDPEAGLFDIC